MERQLKQERRHLVFKLDDISQKHQAVLKANVELRKKVAGLTAELEELSNRQALFFSKFCRTKHLVIRLIGQPFFRT